MQQKETPQGNHRVATLLLPTPRGRGEHPGCVQRRIEAREKMQHRQPSHSCPLSSKASRKSGTPRVCSARVTQSPLFFRIGKRQRPFKNSCPRPSLGCWTNMDERRRRLRFPRGTWPLGKRLNSCPAQRGASDRNVVGKLVSNNSILWRPACAFDDFRPWYYPSLSACFAVTHVHGNLVKSLLWAIDLRIMFWVCCPFGRTLMSSIFFSSGCKNEEFFWKQWNSRRWIALT